MPGTTCRSAGFIGLGCVWASCVFKAPGGDSDGQPGLNSVLVLPAVGVPLVTNDLLHFSPPW